MESVRSETQRTPISPNTRVVNGARRLKQKTWPSVASADINSRKPSAPCVTSLRCVRASRRWTTSERLRLRHRCARNAPAYWGLCIVCSVLFLFQGSAPTLEGALDEELRASIPGGLGTGQESAGASGQGPIVPDVQGFDLPDHGNVSNPNVELQPTAIPPSMMLSAGGARDAASGPSAKPKRSIGADTAQKFNDSGRHL